MKGTQKSAGTPQRILWAPVIYPAMPRPEELPAWPGFKTLPQWPGCKPISKQGKFSFWVKEVDQLADEKPCRRTNYRFRRRSKDKFAKRGTGFTVAKWTICQDIPCWTMLKVAAGFMWLDGRTDKITDEDCELARIVMAISDRTRKHTLVALEKMTKQADTARGKSDGRRELAKAGLLADERRADVERVIARVVPRLAAAEEKTLSGAALKRTMRDVSKGLFDETMAALVDEDRIVATEVEYRGQTGWKYSLIEGG